MSQILQQAEDLRQQAIALLVAERETINQKLNQLGGEAGAVQIKNGRKKSCSRCGVEGHTVRTCPTPSETL